MKTFEERYTAWLDGRMTAGEQAAFEAELETRPLPAESAEDARTAQQLGDLLRKHAPPAPTLTHGDFFNTQLLEQIAREDRLAAQKAAPAPGGSGRSWFSWALPHLAWGGVCCLLLSFTVYREWVAPAKLSGYPQMAAVTKSAPISATAVASSSSAYDARVIQAHSVDPGISATPVQSTSKDGVTVLWLDGLDYLPATYELH